MRTLACLAMSMFLCIFLPACSVDSDVGEDAGQDSGGQEEVNVTGDDGGEVDAGSDPGMDAGEDAGVDDGYDAGLDAGTDAGSDAGSDAGNDAGSDAGTDAGQDAGGGDLDDECGTGATAAECWDCKFNPETPGANYEQFDYILGSHCLGTNHQDITGIERVVFLGDSVTVGTPPNTIQSYRFVLGALLKDKYGLSSSDVKSCADWGARNDDLLLPPNQQILECFPTVPDTRRTLVIMTVGSNDLFAMAQRWSDGLDAGEDMEVVGQEIMGMAEHTMGLFDDAIHWFTDDPNKFPNGVFVMFANIYEYTDGTGDMSSCVLCGAVGLCVDWPQGREPAFFMGEQYMRTAVETGTDMIFLLENFCGHGWYYDDPQNPCYTGPNPERWIDITCLHPEPIGHQQISDMFMSVIEE